MTPPEAAPMREDHLRCQIGSCQRHKSCMYTPCRAPRTQPDKVATRGKADAQYRPVPWNQGERSSQERGNPYPWNTSAYDHWNEGYDAAFQSFSRKLATVNRGGSHD